MQPSHAKQYSGLTDCLENKMWEWLFFRYFIKGKDIKDKVWSDATKGEVSNYYWYI